MRMTIPLIVLLALAGCGGDKQGGVNLKRNTAEQ